MELPSYGYLEGVPGPEGLEQEFAVFLVASYVNDRDLRIRKTDSGAIVQPSD